MKISILDDVISNTRCVHNMNGGKSGILAFAVGSLKRGSLFVPATLSSEEKQPFPFSF